MPSWLEITLGLIAAAGTIFGVYQYFASKREPKLTFDTKELADFRLPPDFYHALSFAPVSVTLFSVGKTAAENIIVHLKTRTQILKADVGSDVEWKSDIEDHVKSKTPDATFTIPKLNPNDTFNILLFCDVPRPPDQLLLSETKVTIAAGKVLDKRALTNKEVFPEALDIILNSSIPSGFTSSLFKALARILVKY